MMKGQWVSNIKAKTGIKIIDVPMPEWINKRFVQSNSYSIFDQVWCLTETSYNIFRKYKNIVKDKVPTRPEQRWVSDITYIKTENGHNYLAIVTDAYSKQIMGYKICTFLK